MACCDGGVSPAVVSCAPLRKSEWLSLRLQREPESLGEFGSYVATRLVVVDF